MHGTFQCTRQNHLSFMLLNSCSRVEDSGDRPSPIHVMFYAAVFMRLMLQDHTGMNILERAHSTLNVCIYMCVYIYAKNDATRAFTEAPHLEKQRNP